MSNPVRFAFLFILLACLGTLLLAQTPALGDYGSVASGNWATLGTWKIYRTSSGAFDSTAAAVPSASSNVWILSGTTVTVDASGKNCKNLLIDTNAVLKTGVALPTSSMRYVNVYGTSVVVNGTLGTLAGDAVCLQMYNSFTITGTGTIRPARIRPGSGQANLTLTIDADIMPMYNGSSGTGGVAVYTSNSSNNNTTVTLNAGRTMTLPNYVYIGAASGPTNDGSDTCTFNINGTLVQSGPYGYMSFRVSSGRLCTVNIGPTGSVSCAESLAVSGAGTTTINIASGGSLTYGTGGPGYGDFSSANTTVNGAGTMTVPAGATLAIGAAAGLDPVTGPIRTTTRTFDPTVNFSFVGTSAQVTGPDLPANVARLTVNNASGLTLTNNVTVDSTLTLTNGVVNAGANTLTLGPSATISGGSSTSFVDGKLAVTVASTGKRVIQIGQGTAFLPVTVNFSFVSGSGPFTTQVLDRTVTPPAGPLDVSAPVLKRYYHVSVGGGITGLAADTAVWSYSDADMAGVTVSKGMLTMYSWNGSSWEAMNVIANDTVANRITVTNINSGDDFIISGPIPPAPTIAPRAFDFGPRSVGSVAADSFYVKNTGSSSLVVSGIAKTKAVYTVVPTAKTIAAGDSAWFVVSFNPAAVGMVTDSLIISHNGLNAKDTVGVRGIGVQSGFGVNPTAVLFGGVPTGQPKMDSVVVTNNGTGSLVIDSIVTSTPTVVVTPAVPATILPAASAKFYLTFTPVSAGDVAGTVMFYHNAPSHKDSVLVSGTGVTGPFFAEDFAATAGTFLTSMGYLVSSGGTTNAIAVTTPGLSFANYAASGAGNAATLTTTGQDVYQSFPFINTGSLYLSFMANVASAQATGDYIIALSPTASQTNYYARLHLKSSGGGYIVGISKSNEVTGGAQYGSTVQSFGSTVLIVVKYTFLPADSNDVINVYVFNSSVPTTEPATPEIANYSGSTKADAVNLGFITLRQGSASAAPALVIDGIRIATTWSAGVPTGIVDAPVLVPRVFELRNNYPNPFNPTTRIDFTVAKDGDASLKVYNMLGQEVATLYNGMARAGELHTTTFDARSLPSGVYFSVLTSEGQRFVKKLMLLK